MANLRVFVSSTAYDLAILRSSLRSFILGLGYDAVLSDYSDVLYDPREHAHQSCLAEVRGCDMVVLVVGARFGSELDGQVLSNSVNDIDSEQLMDGENRQPLSVTQAEALTAAAQGIPIFTFVDSAVYHDYSVYQRNKGQEFASQIIYPSISQPDTAEYIFNFIDYLQSRAFNNAVVTFERMEDVTSHLQKQWAGLFQRMLFEARTRHDETMRIDRLADQFEDLKTALLTTVGDASSRAVARAVLRYRRLVDILRALPNPGVPMRTAIAAGGRTFWELLRDTANVIGITEERSDDERDRGLTNCYLQLENGETLQSRYHPTVFDRVEADWQSFLSLSAADREVVYDALDTDDRIGPPPFRRARRPEALTSGNDGRSGDRTSSVDQGSAASVPGSTMGTDEGRH
jgi:Domain of unknown function (DUF4062)